MKALQTARCSAYSKLLIMHAPSQLRLLTQHAADAVQRCVLIGRVQPVHDAQAYFEAKSGNPSLLRPLTQRTADALQGGVQIGKLQPVRDAHMALDAKVGAGAYEHAALGAQRVHDGRCGRALQMAAHKAQRHRLRQRHDSNNSPSCAWHGEWSATMKQPVPPLSRVPPGLLPCAQALAANLVHSQHHHMSSSPSGCKVQEGSNAEKRHAYTPGEGGWTAFVGAVRPGLQPAVAVADQRAVPGQEPDQAGNDPSPTRQSGALESCINPAHSQGSSCPPLFTGRRASPPTGRRRPSQAGVLMPNQAPDRHLAMHAGCSATSVRCIDTLLALMVAYLRRRHACSGDHTSPSAHPAPANSSRKGAKSGHLDRRPAACPLVLSPRSALITEERPRERRGTAALCMHAHACAGGL